MKLTCRRELANITDNRTISDKQLTGRILASIRLQNFVELRISQIRKRIHQCIQMMVTVRLFDTREWLVYIISKLTLELFWFFILSIIIWHFIGMENRYLSIDCTKTRNKFKRKQNEPKWSNATHNQQLSFTTNCSSTMSTTRQA